jgi:hypothetical protein
MNDNRCLQRCSRFRRRPEAGQSRLGLSAGYDRRAPCTVPAAASRGRRHGPERTASLSKGDIDRMQIRPRARFPDDRGGTPDVIGVTVSKNQML